jgi:hypothetical protein
MPQGAMRFGIAPYGGRAIFIAKEVKVFCFFFSKKKSCLPA